MASGKKKKQKSKHGAVVRGDDLPAVLVPKVDAPPVTIRGRRFDLDDPKLPGWVEKAALRSGGYPYDEKLPDDDYDAALKPLQIELVKLQKWAGETGTRIVILFEGRDAAGKGSTIFAVAQYLNPRGARIVALPKPDETERGQWYFQRYAARLPAAGEIVMFDRSWYNRAGVEPVMGFCTPEQHRLFLTQAPEFEKLLVDQGLALIKIWLEIGREMQLMQFHQRRHDPLKIWKLSPIDYAALTKWDAYTKARSEMLATTHRPATPWTIVRANDKKRARLNIIRSVLSRFDYPGKDRKAIGATDSKIVGSGPDFL